MAHEVLEINKDNIATNSFNTVLSNLLERYNEQVNDTNNTNDLSIYKGILQDLNEAYSLYSKLQKSVLDYDISQTEVLKNDVQLLQQQLNILITDIQSKLDNGDFVGHPGTTDYNNLENLPSLFSGNYADLSNKPFTNFHKDIRLGNIGKSNRYLNVASFHSQGSHEKIQIKVKKQFGMYMFKLMGYTLQSSINGRNCFDDVFYFYQNATLPSPFTFSFNDKGQFGSNIQFYQTTDDYIGIELSTDSGNFYYTTLVLDSMYIGNGYPVLSDDVEIKADNERY